MKVVIVGGVAGGATAAARLRRLDEQAEIIMIERSGYVSYANCGLPYYIGGDITDKHSLTLQTPESFKNRFNIDARVQQEVISIDRFNKYITVHDLISDTEYSETYDKLVLAPGAKAIRPQIPGYDLPQVFSVRTIEDTFAISEFIESCNPQRAVVIGAGFIGMEMVESLSHRGLSVALLQRASHVMNPFDADMAAFLHNELRSHGVDVYLKSDVCGLYATDDGIAVDFVKKDMPVDSACTRLYADMVIMAIGVEPETHLARQAGLALGLKNTIAVDSRMCTSDPDIYAVGDAVQITHMVTGYPAVISLAGLANKQGRVAADNIFGLDHEFSGGMGSSIMKFFDLTVASTGLSVEAAHREGITCDYVIVPTANHASYYPGAKAMTLKVVYDTETFQVLGAQIVGSDGVDKRIDVLAMAIFSGLDCYDLADLDLSYAPPYSSAKDPVNVAGYIMQNICDGVAYQVHWSDVERDVINAETCTNSVVVLDVRRPSEFACGHVDGALNIPVDELRDRINEIPEGKRVYVYCATGLRSHVACCLLTQCGFESCNVSGGWKFYQSLALDKRMQLEGTNPCGL